MRLGSFYYGVWSTFGNVSVCSALFWLWFLVYEVIILCHLSSSQRLAESFPMLNFFRLDYTRSPTRWTFFQRDFPPHVQHIVRVLFFFWFSCLHHNVSLLISYDFTLSTQI